MCCTWFAGMPWWAILTHHQGWPNSISDPKLPQMQPVPNWFISTRTIHPNGSSPITVILFPPLLLKGPDDSGSRANIPSILTRQQRYETWWGKKGPETSWCSRAGEGPLPRPDKEMIGHPIVSHLLDPLRKVAVEVWPSLTSGIKKRLEDFVS